MAEKIAVIVGSLSSTSINRKFAEALVKLAPAGVDFDFIDMGDLPVYNRDDDDRQPAAAVRIKKQIEAADGLLIVTPEYNRSIPAALKNVIDHASRPSHKSSWFGHRGATIGVSGSPLGTALAQQHLRSILASQGVSLMLRPEGYIQYTEALVTDSGEIGEGSRDFLKKWMESFLRWVDTGSMGH